MTTYSTRLQMGRSPCFFFFSCYRDREVLLKLKVTLTPKSGIKVWRDFKLLSKEFEHMHLPVRLY